MTDNRIILNNKIHLNTKSDISDIYGVATPHEIELHNTDFALILKKSGFHNMAEYQELHRQYILALIDNGYGLRRSQLKAKDQIDFTPLISANTESEINYVNYPVLYSEEYLEYLRKISEDKELSFCHAVPCFQDVAMRINKKRWIHVKTKEIDTENHNITIFIQDYAIQAVWTPGISGTGILSFNDDSVAILRPQNDVTDINAICKLYTENMPWKTWQKKSFIQVNEYVCKKFKDKSEKENADSFTKFFAIMIKFIGLANYMLTRERPKLIREPREKKPASNSSMSKTDTPLAPAVLRTRTVGLVTFKSEKVPKAPNTESIRHYKTAVWKAKGGIRHMKDGRLIPFKECVKHRKVLLNKCEDQKPAPAAVKIRLSDNRPKN